MAFLGEVDSVLLELKYTPKIKVCLGTFQNLIKCISVVLLEMHGGKLEDGKTIFVIVFTD